MNIFENKKRLCIKFTFSKKYMILWFFKHLIWMGRNVFELQDENIAVNNFRCFKELFQKWSLTGWSYTHDLLPRYLSYKTLGQFM